MNKALLLLPLATALCSCSSVQVTRLRVVNDLVSATSASQACFKALKQNQRYVSMYRNLALEGIKPTPQQLADETPVTDVEIQTGIKWFTEDQRCAAQSIQEFSNLNFQLGAKVAGWQTEITDIFNDTINSRPTYGHINTKINHLTEVKAKDIRDWINSETARRQAVEDQKNAQTVAFATEMAFAVLTGAIQALQARELAIDQSQHQYAGHRQNYVPQAVGITHCSLQQAPRYSLVMNPSAPVVVCTQN